MTDSPLGDLATWIAELYDDPRRCAQAAALNYVSPDEPGVRRLRCGKGFTYRTADGRTLNGDQRRRIQSLAIPPAWRNVWVCADEDGHLVAAGEDDRGRKQYLYHERWRSLRDQLNFYRLVVFGRYLPAIRADVRAQLARGTIDREVVLAAMLRVIDRAGIRVGNEVYAEENNSYGLSTLTKKHVAVHGNTLEFRFVAKSGTQADISFDDAEVAPVIEELLRQRSRRLFTVDRMPVTADAVNGRLSELTDVRLTAKDFRTWRGTRTAFAVLRKNLAAEPSDGIVLQAVDAAAEALGNTRAVASAHYVHPDVVTAYSEGELAAMVNGDRPRGSRYLDTDERLLLHVLDRLLQTRAAGLALARDQQAV